MKLQPIVRSLLDTDLYKFNMDQVIFHKHTDLSGEYYFRCRNEGVVFTREMFREINEQIDHLCTLTFTKDELDYLRSIRFIKHDYVEFLRLWRPIRDYVETELTDTGELKIVVRGPLFSAMQFEIYLLEIVNEVYFRMKYDYETLKQAAKEKLDEKIRAFRDGKYTFRFAEFGCRRRLSREWEDEVVRRLASETKNCFGTSNVLLAKKYGLKPIGTYAHEFVQMYQGIDSIPQGMAFTPSVFTVQAVFDEVRSQVPKPADGVELRFEPSSLRIWGDRALTVILLRNLIGNALKHTVQGSVTASAAEEGDMVHLTVVDTGSGMNAEQQESLFRADRTLPEGSEHGFGLILCRYIVRRHDDLTRRGCRIWVESTPGEGTKMHCLLAKPKD